MGGPVNVGIPTIHETLVKLAAVGQRLGSSTMKRRAGPCTVTEGDKLYTLATDSRLMLAVEETADWLSKTAKPLALPNADIVKERHRVAIVILRGFVGRPQWAEKCPACLGTAANSEHVSCDFCEGDGIVGTKLRPGYLFDVPVNLEYFARACESQDSTETVEIILSNAKPACFWIVGYNWRAVIMGMDPAGIANDPMERETWKDAPRFPKPVEPVTEHPK
jgi:hypothetical protein